jgi:hypothetical protein
MIFKGEYEIKPSTFLSDNPPKNHWDLVKWGINEYGDKYCYVIATMWYNEGEDDWEFKSIGTRFFDEYTSGLTDFVKASISVLECCREKDDD